MSSGGLWGIWNGLREWECVKNEQTSVPSKGDILFIGIWEIISRIVSLTVSQ